MLSKPVRDLVSREGTKGGVPVDRTTHILTRFARKSVDGKKVDLRSTCLSGIYLPARFGKGKRGGQGGGSELLGGLSGRRAGSKGARGARYPNDVIGLALSTINMTMWLLNGTFVRMYGPPMGCVFRLNACRPDA